MDKNMKRLFFICWCAVSVIFTAGIITALVLGNLQLAGLFGFMLGVFLIPPKFDPAVLLKQWQINRRKPSRRRVDTVSLPW